MVKSFVSVFEFSIELALCIDGLSHPLRVCPNLGEALLVGPKGVTVENVGV